MITVLLNSVVRCGIMRTFVEYCGDWAYQRDRSEALPRMYSLRQGNCRRSKAVFKLQPLHCWLLGRSIS